MKPAAGLFADIEMDIVTHAITGAITGAHWNRPILGAAVAVAPDLVLGVKRRALPSLAYSVTHSPLLMSVVLSVATGALTRDPALTACVIACYLSHVTLDLQTHGGAWAPRLFFPFSKRRTSLGDDWEFFNRAWWLGLLTAFLWSLVWLLASLESDTGYQLLRSALSTAFPT